MQPNDRIRLQHILDESNEINKFVKGYNYERFKNDNKTVHAVLRAIEIIGEAAGKISPEFKTKHHQIEWNHIVGMRNHLIHVYFDIDYVTVWATIKKDVPRLITTIKKLLKSKD